jgi:hypothetical protein
LLFPTERAPGRFHPNKTRIENPSYFRNEDQLALCEPGKMAGEVPRGKEIAKLGPDRKDHAFSIEL